MLPICESYLLREQPDISKKKGETLWKQEKRSWKP